MFKVLVFYIVYVLGIHSLYRKSQSAMTANVKKMDESVAFVLRKNYNLTIIPAKIKRYKLARKHLKATLWNWKKNPLKASEYMLLAFQISC